MSIFEGTIMKDVKRIVVIGPESTGKSTLSVELAAALNTLWVPEFARGYLMDLGRDYVEEDLQKIANGQVRKEDETATKVDKFLICDTDLYVLKVWAEAKYLRCHTAILEEIAKRKYDLYLLTYIDVLWEDDPLREHSSVEERHYFYSQYRDIVINSGVPWADIRGDNQQRLQMALNAIVSLTTDTQKNE